MKCLKTLHTFACIIPRASTDETGVLHNIDSVSYRGILYLHFSSAQWQTSAGEIIFSNRKKRKEKHIHAHTLMQWNRLKNVFCILCDMIMRPFIFYLHWVDGKWFEMSTENFRMFCRMCVVSTDCKVRAARQLFSTPLSLFRCSLDLAHIVFCL